MPQAPSPADHARTAPAAIDGEARLLTGIPGARVNDRYGPINEEIARIEARKAQLEARKRGLEARKNRLPPPPESERTAETITPREVPGLKVHIATLVAPDTAPGEPWQEVYIHAKLMMIDDTLMTAGSAIINSRPCEERGHESISRHSQRHQEAASVVFRSVWNLSAYWPE